MAPCGKQKICLHGVFLFFPKVSLREPPFPAGRWRGIDKEVESRLVLSDKPAFAMPPKAASLRPPGFPIGGPQAPLLAVVERGEVSERGKPLRKGFPLSEGAFAFFSHKGKEGRPAGRNTPGGRLSKTADPVKTLQGNEKKLKSSSTSPRSGYPSARSRRL